MDYKPLSLGPYERIRRSHSSDNTQLKLFVEIIAKWLQMMNESKCADSECHAIFGKCLRHNLFDSPLATEKY